MRTTSDFAVNGQEGLLEVYCNRCETHVDSIPINHSKPYEDQVPDVNLCFSCKEELDEDND